MRSFEKLMRDPVHTQADASVGPEPPETVTSKLIDEDFAELSDYEDFVMIMNGRLGKLLLSLSRESASAPWPPLSRYTSLPLNFFTRALFRHRRISCCCR